MASTEDVTLRDQPGNGKEISPVSLRYFAFLLLLLLGQIAVAEEARSLYPKEVYDVLSSRCFDCHGDGMQKGKVAFDGFTSHEEMIARRELWMAVLKNVRAGIMPPEKRARPDASEIGALEKWIKTQMFELDLSHPDPGRVTLRRLNRVEYRNTIRDLTGFDINVDEELPPDDTGYGFDTIGDVLTLSPLLLEKYMGAAERIATESVPRASGNPAEKSIRGADFHSLQGEGTGERLNFYRAATVSHQYHAAHDGSYHFRLNFEVRGDFDFDPGKCQAVLKADDRQIWEMEFGWQNRKKFTFDLDQKLAPGDHVLTLELHPLIPEEQRKNSLELRLSEIQVVGPLEEKWWVRPKNFDRFFWKEPSKKPEERNQYAREVLNRFVTKAYRRPADENTLNRLVAIAKSVYEQPGKSFPDGIAQAVIPVLASPRFLFRVERAEVAGTSEKYPLVDEYALASRLSYFLWSTMPDEELFRLAASNALRKNLANQVKRMIDDPRSQAFVENFVGQWLQVRDVEGINIDERSVLARDRGEDKELERRIHRFRELNAIPEEQRTPEQVAELKQMMEQRRKRMKTQRELELDHELRSAFRDETQMDFGYVMKEDRNVLELVDSDYTFLNERLALHYGITNVSGKEMRRVSLPADSPRGGVLTQGSILIVTSNPTRTSPVKRGLFILDNILGIPPPPPPANVPPLEDSEKEFGSRQPTLRETLEVHRNKPLCSSCHNRMDPLGLALENFNALGMWRQQERGVPIDAAGKLITGEAFDGIRDVKNAISARHRLDFYRCLTEKLFTYALGRGLEYYDVESVDHIVERLDKANGRFSALLTGIIESSPFQRTRKINPVLARGSSNSDRVLK